MYRFTGVWDVVRQGKITVESDSKGNDFVRERDDRSCYIDTCERREVAETGRCAK